MRQVLEWHLQRFSVSRSKLFPGDIWMLGGNLRSQSLTSSRRRLGVEEKSTRARARQQQPGKTGWRSGPTAQPQPTNTGRELMGTQHLARRTRHQFGLGVGCSLWPEILQSRLCCILPCQLRWPVGTSDPRRQLQDPRTRCSWDALPQPLTVRERLRRAAWLPRAA